MKRPAEPPLLVGAGDWVLRPFVFEDAEAILEVGLDPYIPLITTVPSGGDLQAAHQFIERQWRRSHEGEGYSFAIARSSGGSALGQVGVWLRDLEQYRRLTLGYWVFPSQRRHGIASSALALATQWAMETFSPVRCQVFIEPWNTGSCRAAERAGYEREGLLRAWQEIEGKWRDMLVYSVLGE